MCIIILSVFNYFFYDLKLVHCYLFKEVRYVGFVIPSHLSKTAKTGLITLKKCCKDLSFDKSVGNLKVKQTR